MGEALLAQGRFREARDATRRCLDLLPQGHPQRASATRQLQRCERLLGLEGRLPAVLRGQDQPANAAERLEFADLCTIKKQYAAPVRFYAAAFAAEPTRADDRKALHRYNAACAASLAGSGLGADAAPLDAPERSRWRQQAREWLAAELMVYTQQLQSQKPEDRRLALQRLGHWQRDPDLGSVRDPQALAKLPADERAAWEKLWGEVAALLQQAQASK